VPVPFGQPEELGASLPFGKSIAASEATTWVTREKLMSMAAIGVLPNKPRNPERP
jgi:hypothetical protein